jgi:hypothetical protein
MRKLRSWTCLLVLVGVVGVCFGKDTITIPNTPEGTVETITKSMAEFKPQVVWNALPSKYQADVKGLIGLFAENMDQEVYDKGVATLDKLAGILKNKKEFIANNAIIKQQLEQNKVDADDFSTSLDSASKIISTLTKSDLGSVAKLKTLDPEKFLATTCSKLMKDSYDIAQSFDKDEKLPDIEDMKKIKVTVVEKTDDKAKVSVDSEGDEEEAKEKVLVLVDGKWVPEDMAADWDKNIEAAKGKLKEMKITPESKTQALMVFGMVDGMLTGLADAKTQADFDKAVMGIVMMAMQGQGGGPGGPGPGGPPPGAIPGN